MRLLVAATITFFALAAYVGVESVLTALSLVITPFPPTSSSRSAVADSEQTLLCTHPSGVLLVGLLLNAALVIGAVALKEGRGAWRGHHCC